MDTMLEDVLLALQKSFSRLSAETAPQTADENKQKATALIVGEVDFEITLNVEPVLSLSAQKRVDATLAANSPPSSGATSTAREAMDSLRYCAAGQGMALRLKGRISTDLRVEDKSTAGG